MSDARPAMLIVPIIVMITGTAPAADPRVRTVIYSATEVVPLTGHYGYQMLVALEPSERIENISIGDSVAWAVTPNKAANGVFLKPVEPNAATNMTVQTDKRTYLFELSARQPARGGATPGMTYKVEFRYPSAPREPRAPSIPVALNRDYRMKGAAQLKPAQLFDDGRATYFAWPAGVPVPAIFVVDGSEEALVNHQTRSGYVVVDRVAQGFVLRAGKARVRIINRGYGRPQAAPGGPA